MAPLKAARAADVVRPAKPDPDIIAAELDGLLASCAAAPRIRGTEAMAAARDAAAAAEGRPPLVVVGHRGKGMNALASCPDPRVRGDVRENTLRAFNGAAAAHPAVAYVEFDVQVTKDGCPVIFHDNFIYTEQNGEISGKRVTELCLDEFLAYGPQRNQEKAGKPLLRKLKDGRILRWDVRSEDALCTLREAFQSVDRRVEFNVELKFDDDLVYTEESLTGVLQAVLKVVFEHANGRPIIFSSFQPDAAQLIRRLQDKYPVYFLTNGGTQIYADQRRSSLEEAVRLCVAGGLQGIVSEVRAILRQPAAVAKIKEEAKLSLMTYGQLNNVPEVVYVQHLMGVDGVVVDLVREIAEAVSAFSAAREPCSEACGKGERSEAATAAVGTPSFSPRSFSGSSPS
ncbi:Glycerophosphodiester phosphodiesterase GDPD2 [Dichanthelium oligosanthes]|uniref:glycerophosphodiester phosphodiesterase n=1 Tax=Dichanthelium oligosanthes TaxID=888268 RepID=A0A1E5WM81_9POAL|nr:Glycerophosphodiester phosphodiesterase GDPD2 [Dichanthelium oligosanthes]